MNQEPGDRRVRRTRERLRQALLDLILDKGWDQITVQDILDRADVGRSTFYAHYRDKEDLLLSGFEDIRAALAAEVAAGEGARGAPAGSAGPLLEPVLVVFRHVDAYRESWKALTQKGGIEVIVRILRQSVAELVDAHLRSRFPEARRDATRLDATTSYLVGGCMGLLIWWLDNDIPLTPEEIHGVFQQVATEGVARFLAGG